MEIEATKTKKFIVKGNKTDSQRVEKIVISKLQSNSYQLSQ
jgi:hypothetical protein